MRTEVRVLKPSEWDVWHATLERAFGGAPLPQEEQTFWRGRLDVRRALGTWDGADCVGTAGAFSLQMSVPGGHVVPTAGVTMVSVAATHRRRGLLTGMMRRQLADARAWGEPLAALTASEPGIYGRFGYGIATTGANLDIETQRVQLAAPEGTDDVRVRYASPAAAEAACEAVYAQRAGGRPGMLARQPGWARLPLLDPPESRRGGSPLQCVLAESGGRTVGYARFQTRLSWNTEGPDGAVALRDVEALDPAAYAALWRFLCSIDLTDHVFARSRPVDDPLLHLVSDVRRCRLTLVDGVHLRLVDVGAALQARGYRTPLDVVLEVDDAFCPWNAGRWRLVAEPDGSAVCSRTDVPAQLALSVRDLATAYLGGTSLMALAAAGRVRELRTGALQAASAAFGWDVAPWLPHGF